MIFAYAVSSDVLDGGIRLRRVEERIKDCVAVVVVEAGRRSRRSRRYCCR